MPPRQVEVMGKDFNPRRIGQPQMFLSVEICGVLCSMKPAGLLAATEFLRGRPLAPRAPRPLPSALFELLLFRCCHVRMCHVPSIQIPRRYGAQPLGLRGARLVLRVVLQPPARLHIPICRGKCRCSRSCCLTKSDGSRALVESSGPFPGLFDCAFRSVEVGVENGFVLT